MFFQHEVLDRHFKLVPRLLALEWSSQKIQGIQSETGWVMTRISCLVIAVNCLDVYQIFDCLTYPPAFSQKNKVEQSVSW